MSSRSARLAVKVGHRNPKGRSRTMSLPQIHRPGSGPRRDGQNSSGSSSKLDRLPPQNLEAEKSALGSCLLDNTQIDEVALWVSPEDFYRSDHTEIMTAI